MWAALVKAADNMAPFYNVHRCNTLKYNIGNKVWLSSENIRTVPPTKKLNYKWLGPYPVCYFHSILKSLQEGLIDRPW